MCEVVLRRTCGVAVRIVAWNCWIENEVRVHRSTYKDSVGGRAKRSLQAWMGTYSCLVLDCGPVSHAPSTVASL